MRKYTTGIAIIVFAFLFLPLLLIAITSFGTAKAIQFPIQGFTLDWYANALSNQTMLRSFRLSLIVGVLATLLAMIIGIPTSYVLSRYEIKGKNWIKSFFLSPTLIPGIVVGFTLFQFIVVQLGLPIFQGLLIGHFLISLPYIIRVVGGSMEQLDISTEEAAWTLGCTRLKAFLIIVLPNLTSGIFASFMLAFVNSFNNVPVSMFLSGPGVTMLPTSLLSYLEFNYDPTISAISVMLMILTIGMMFLIEKTLGLTSIT
jgi:putative spermidine/putrescine transport system permease protein